MRNRFTLPLLSAILISAGACKSETKGKTVSQANREFWVLSESRPFQYFHLDVEANKFDGGQELATEWGNADFLRETGSWRFETGEQGFTLHSGKGEALALAETDRGAYKGNYAHDEAAGYLKVSLSLSGAPVNERVWQYFSKEDSLYAYLKKAGRLKLDVIWGPTQPEVMEQMFIYTKPKAGDVVYDLGCGDGRILITAAEKFGVRGVGADIDPMRIAAGEKVVKQKKLESKVTLVNKNLFDMDISEASIVTLYLNIKVNRRLRPKLFRELKAGTRIVSHNWHMGDWLPETFKYVSEGKRVVYFWVMPENFSGTYQGGTADKPVVLKLKQRFQNLYGDITIAGKSYPVSGKIRGTSVALWTTAPELSGATLSLGAESLSIKPTRAPVFTLTREAGTRLTAEAIAD
jgi:SAM-dependent methyltransferase